MKYTKFQMRQIKSLQKLDLKLAIFSFVLTLVEVIIQGRI